MTKFYRAKIKMIKTTFVVIAILLFVLFGSLVYYDKNGAFPTLIAILLAVLATRLEDLEKISLFGNRGLEAELKGAIKEANATIEQLRALSRALAEPLVTSITMMGKTMQYVHLKYKIRDIKNIEDAMQKLGVNENDIHETTKFFFKIIEDNHIKKVIIYLKDQLPNGHELKVENDEIDCQIHTYAKIKNVIKTKEINISGELDECIKDLDFFLEKRELRREKNWQN